MKGSHGSTNSCKGCIQPGLANFNVMPTDKPMNLHVHSNACITSEVAVMNLVARVGAEIIQEGLSSSEQEQEDVVYQDDCLYDIVSQLLIRSDKDVQGQHQANEQHWHKLGKKKEIKQY